MKILASLLLAFTAAATEPTPLQRLIDQAPSAPPEIAADILTRVVEQRLVRERKAAIELLDRAWHYSTLARLPMPTRRSGGIATTERYNALALQLRILKALKPLDAGLALNYLRSLPAPVPPPLECADRRVWDPSPWYEAIGLLGDLEDRAHAIRQVTHPSQLVPSLELVIDFQGGVEDRAMLAVWWAGALKSARGDSIAFDGTRELPARIAQLAETLRAGEAGAGYLAYAWREYVLAHWQGEVCAYLISPATLQSWRTRTEAIYNQRLRAASASDAPPIDFDEDIKPSRVIATPPRVRNEEIRSRQEGWILFLGGLTRLIPALGPEAAEADVLQAVNEALRQLDEWEQPVEGVPPGEWLYIRISAAQTLLQSAGGEARTAILRWMLKTLRYSELQRTAPAHWLLAWRQVLAAAPADLIRQEGDALMELLLLAREILGWQ